MLILSDEEKMPELPEVETIKEAMRKSVEGAFVESVKVLRRDLRLPIDSHFEKNITGKKIERLYRIAKYAVMELEGGNSVIWHFGMSGKIKISHEENPELQKHDHVVIKTNKGTIIYNDPRRFGVVTLAKSDRLDTNPLFKSLGLDPFDKKLNEKYLTDKLKNKTVPIKVALLDQSIISGIGNIYASEALYEARISPLRQSLSLTLSEIKRLIESIKQVLLKAIAAGGSTLHDYRKPDGDIGYFQFQHAVYGKAGKKCPNCVCQKGILHCVQAGRSTYYCQRLQK